MKRNRRQMTSGTLIGKNRNFKKGLLGKGIQQNEMPIEGKDNRR
ncbi:hypothetical protein ACNKHO_15060 [Shigella flexneri]